MFCLEKIHSPSKYNKVKLSNLRYVWNKSYLVWETATVNFV